jgi:ubiquinone/menaquinone biosynthesis C-methylase UbiE
MIDYYSKRAREYERVYQKPERQADLGWLRATLRRELAGHRVLELACGTGYWTDAIAGTAASIHATDASTEVLENFPTPEELREIFAPFSERLEVLTSDHFWCSSYRTAAWTDRGTGR